MTDRFAEVIDGLVARGFVVLRHWLDTPLRQALRSELLIRSDELQRSRIGRQDDHQQRPDIRNDQTLWLSGQSLQQQQYLQQMQALQQALNQQLFLGLRDFECHFAHYPPGHFYQTHLDAFRGQSNRVVSCVVYLNESWPTEQGGELVIYDHQQQPLAVVKPEPGTLVCFMSEDFPHEVRPSPADRYSIAGWFRRDRPLL
ncbi:2OG-Fe(II) oxygenase [Gallaecimonas sp. GXIMD1310]|uniref:2OG-Fe(II) oxygenase n=1 Tax=Gallaecimonas sp. GXIMD1310 TaxID=3131926 RepID=UPI00325257CD